ncbi:histidine--tRNA ligase [Candidatus Daviesbacteria bacterium]|nr:histidine--tRNA ligase [Candidatus Daviesbacteria bacterium]
MQNIRPQTLKGFRDFLPGETRKRQYVINRLKAVFESFGFEPLETPALEYEEVLLGKYGEEGDKLMYRFEDNGGRKVALRYDQTVPLARVVTQYSNLLPIPFKRYQIQPVWRAENPQKGRFREFLQCDIDTVGSNSPMTDAEIIQAVIKSLENLGFTNFKVLVNDRNNFAGIEPSAIVTIDKLKKIGQEAVLEELKKKGLPTSSLTEVLNKGLTEKLKNITDIVNDSRVVFDSTLARGLDYYTGLIFEIEIDGYEAGSVGGGGRYDNLIGMFAGRQIPAVGFAFGFDRLIEAMNQQNLFPKDLTTTQVLVTIFNPDLQNNSLEISSQLRSNNINTEVWLDPNSKLEKQLKYADQKGIPYVAIIGPEEAAKNVVTLKNLANKTQEVLSLDEAIVKIMN